MTELKQVLIPVECNREEIQELANILQDLKTLNEINNDLSIILNNQNDKNGILLLFKHSLHLELDSRILAMHAEIYGIEREHNSKMFENIQRSGRLKSMKGITDRDNTLTFMRWLKKGKTVLYAPDQDYGIKKSIKVNFFGIPAATVTAPLKIIEKTNKNVEVMVYDVDNFIYFNSINTYLSGLFEIIQKYNTDKKSSFFKLIIIYKLLNKYLQKANIKQYQHNLFRRSVLCLLILRGINPHVTPMLSSSLSFITFYIIFTAFQI